MMKNNSATINVLRDGNMMKSLVKMGLPMVISMLIMAVYNIADTFWVSHLGTIPIAAVSIVFPFALIFTGVGLTFGVGGEYLSPDCWEKRSWMKQALWLPFPC